MKPPRQTQRKFAFKLSYSTTTTTKNKETLHFSIDLFIHWIWNETDSVSFQRFLLVYHYISKFIMDLQSQAVHRVKPLPKYRREAFRIRAFLFV